MIVIADLDKTVIKTDLLYESLFKLLKKNFLYVFLVPFWLLGGRAKLKREIAKRTNIDPTTLPYNQDVISYLKRQKSSGKKLYLVSASDINYLKPISEHLSIFEGFQGSDGQKNLKGKVKAEYLTKTYGSSFTYVGDSRSDFHIWQVSEGAVPVGTPKFHSEVESKFNVEEKIEFDKRSPFKLFIKAIRVHQWAKNILLFLPLLLSHKIFDFELLIKAVYAFFSFSFCASSVYVLNDLLDLDADRMHESKKSRPFASGELPLSLGMILAPMLLLLSAIVAVQVSQAFVITLLVYFTVTTAYSIKLKSLVLWDVLILACLFTLRVFAGSAATGIYITEWLLGFSVFFFLSLAHVKRVAELTHLRNIGRKFVAGRGYQVQDSQVLTSVGVSSGMISILIFVQYLNTESVQSLYQEPKYLWLVGLCLLFWMSRVWLLTLRDQMHDDPVVFALKDTGSYIIGLIVGVIFYFAM
tara:strand:+ start:58438 stop:59844 length:1407 start_codon:yes stop_codon:yes gene_type:complete